MLLDIAKARKGMRPLDAGHFINSFWEVGLAILQEREGLVKFFDFLSQTFAASNRQSIADYSANRLN